MPRAHIARRTPLASAAFVADVVSFGYVLTAIVVTVALEVDFSLIQALAVIGLFVGLRYVAHEIRTSADAAQLADGRRIAELRAASPLRWSVEQRDGLGRRVDLDA